MDDKYKNKIIEDQKLAFKIKTNKIKKTIFGSIVKELKNFIRKIYWKFNFNFFYFLKTFINFKKKNIRENKISILVPSRKRSKKIHRFLETIKLKSSKLNRLELIILLDEDEVEQQDYFRIFKSYQKYFDIKVFQTNLNTHAQRNNFLAKKSTGYIIFPANDDLIIETNRWDEFVDIEVAKFRVDEPFCLWIDSGNKYPFLHCHFPIINKVWYNKLGYVGSELFNFWYLDTWICELAKKSKKMIYVEKIKFKEFNAQSHIEEFDETYMKNISDNKMEKDIDIWNNSADIRAEESKKLIN